MFHFLLAAVLLAAGVHIARGRERTLRRSGELVLRYLLVGYCGIPMLVISVLAIMYPSEAAATLRFPPGNPFQAFLFSAYLGMSLAATMSTWYRGTFIVGPAVVWAVFFAGATVIHLGEFGSHGSLSHVTVLTTFATHGLISVLLVGALVVSGQLKQPR